MNKKLILIIVGISLSIILLSLSIIIKNNKTESTKPRYLQNCGNILDGDLPLNYEELGIKVIDMSENGCLYLIEDNNNYVDKIKQFINSTDAEGGKRE